MFIPVRDCLLGLDVRPEVGYVELAQEGCPPLMAMPLRPRESRTHCLQTFAQVAFRQPFIAPLDWVDASQGTAVNLPAAVAGNKKQEETRWVPIEASAIVQYGTT